MTKIAKTSSAALVPHDERWRHGSVNIRLSKARKEQLQALASLTHQAVGPRDAIDCAIELALTHLSGDTPRSQEHGELQKLRLELAAISQDSQRRALAQERQLAQITSDMARLAELISTAAGDEDSVVDVECGFATAPLALRAWLDSQRLPAEATISVLATWLACRRDEGGLNAVEMKVKRSGPGKNVARVHVGRVPDASPLARPLAEPIALLCRRKEQGWAVRMKEINANGKLGALIATMSV